jgi:mannose-6-phosphate isomerase-like protein (cupin superfamily)
MLKVGDRFENPRTGASFEVLRAPGDDERVLDLRRTIKPGTGKVLPHVHLDYVERFVVESGQARAKLDGRTVRLGPGDELEVPLEGSHVNAWNDGSADLIMRHVFDPVSDFALGYVETLGHRMRAGRTNRQGENPLIAVFAIADATDSQTFAAGPPRGFQRRAAAPLGAAIARRRGYDIRVPR